MTIPRNHPVRTLLDQAAGGHPPSAKQLDALNEFDLPEGEGLARYRSAITASARRVAHESTNGQIVGRRAVEHEMDALAASMTPAERALDSDPPSMQEDLTTIANRMFGR